MINVARFAFGLNMFTTLPLELFVCREVCGQGFHPSCLMNEVHCSRLSRLFYTGH